MKAKTLGVIIMVAIGLFFAVCAGLCLNAAFNGHSAHINTFMVFAMLSVGSFAWALAGHLDLIS